MKTRFLPFAVLVGSSLVISLGGSAMSQTTYSYTGNPFTSFGGSYSSPPECRVTASITLAEPLAPNLSSAPISPTSFTFTDGNLLWTDQNASPFDGFQVSTDANANITEWYMLVVQYLPSGDFTIQTQSRPSIGQVDDHTREQSPGGARRGCCIVGEAFSYNNPAAWTTNSSPGSACGAMIGGVNFGSAGPNSWGILALGGSGAAGFGSRGTQVSINGGGAGIYGNATEANMGIAGTGNASGWGGGTPQPTVDGTLYYASTNSQAPNTNGVTVVGGVVQNDTLLASAATDAANGLSAAEALGCNMGSLCGTALTTSQIISPVNPGGQNVLTVSGINLGNGVTLTLGGPAGTNWVVIATGNLTLNSGTIALASGLTPSNALIIVQGNLSTSGGLHQESVINGVVVLPGMSNTGSAQLSPGRINGEIIVGSNKAAFSGGGSVNIPQ